MKIIDIQVDSLHGSPAYAVASNYGNTYGTKASPHIAELCSSFSQAEKDLQAFKASDPTTTFEIVRLNCEVVR